jgi:hypothetical protein
VSAGAALDQAGGEEGDDDVVVVGTIAAPQPLEAPLLAQLAAREAELAAKEAELAAREAELAAMRATDVSLLCTAPLPLYWEPYTADEDRHAVKFVVLPFEGRLRYGIQPLGHVKLSTDRRRFAIKPQALTYATMLGVSAMRFSSLSCH